MAFTNRGSPTVETLFAMSVASVAYWALGFVQLGGLFVLAPPLLVRPWTLVASVYAHATLGHLLGNLLAVALLGALVERRTNRLRFHGFFVGSGAVAGATQVLVGSTVGGSIGVLGASGAAFALLGYVLTGNPVSGGLFERLPLSGRAQAVAFAVAAAVLTLVVSPPGTALLAHFAGLLTGLVTGRLRLLRVTA